jgi:MFS family permease
MVISVLTNPGYYRPHTDAASFVVAFAAASPLMSRAHVISGIVLSYLLPAGLLAMAWLALQHAPWWASSAALILMLGLLPAAIFAGQDALSYDIARMGSNPVLLTLARQFDRDEVMSYFNVAFDFGSILGPTLLGIALWRARALPTWAALLITISRPLVFLYPVLPAQWQLGFLVQIPSSLLLFLGSIPAARALLKTPHGKGVETANDRQTTDTLRKI